MHFSKNKNKTSLVCTRSRTRNLLLPTLVSFTNLTLRSPPQLSIMMQHLDQTLRFSIDKYRVTLVTTPLHFFGLIHLGKIGVEIIISERLFFNINCKIGEKPSHTQLEEKRARRKNVCCLDRLSLSEVKKKHAL